MRKPISIRLCVLEHNSCMQIGFDIAFIKNIVLLFHAYFIIFNASEKIYADCGEDIKKKIALVKEMIGAWTCILTGGME